MSPESIVVISSAAVTVLTLLINSYFTNRRFLALREQDRLDRESEANMRRQDKEELMRAGESRKNEILRETKQVKSVAVKSALKSEQALRVANGHNEKIEAAVEVSKSLLENMDKLDELRKFNNQ